MQEYNFYKKIIQYIILRIYKCKEIQPAADLYNYGKKT